MSLEVSPAAKRLAKHLTALPQTTMRESSLQSYLESAPPEEAVQTLDDFRRLGGTGTAPYNIALLALVGVLTHELLDYALIRALYNQAKAANLTALRSMFFSAEAMPDVNPTGHERDGRESTLGHRKTMARSSSRDTLNRLLRDPELPVIEILLDNPMLTERDIVRLIARRSIDPQIRRKVFGSRKWLARYAVKRAFALNPSTPPDLSIRLLGFLSSQDLRKVALTPGVAEMVSQIAKEVIAERKRGPRRRQVTERTPPSITAKVQNDSAQPVSVRVYTSAAIHPPLGSNTNAAELLDGDGNDRA